MLCLPLLPSASCHQRLDNQRIVSGTFGAKFHKLSTFHLFSLFFFPTMFLFELCVPDALSQSAPENTLHLVILHCPVHTPALSQQSHTCPDSAITHLLSLFARLFLAMQDHCSSACLDIPALSASW